jgi:formylglycine-generating enzyme required for sulfatase activity
VAEYANASVDLDPDDAFWDGGIRPEWVVDWGRDSFGVWAKFGVGAVTQTLRWIPPDKFLMGSPVDEEGRCDDEGPQHEVTIGRGFWMFDTPCTQALWEAVMGNNPSHFRGSTRPVEQVTWNEVQGFLRRTAGLVPGLRLELPSEKQWEYACRAGSRAARHGDVGEIAWYRGNSGGQTHPVAEKSHNAWGLYDMLGNVWEWCADSYRQYGSVESGAWARVYRGGSWNGDVMDVRAACRDRLPAHNRTRIIGFRCAEFKAPGPAGRSRDVERGGSESQHGAGYRGARATPSAAAWLRPGERGEELNPIPISVLAPIQLPTDLGSLTIQPVSLPPWASEMGRDRYGLWAEFTVDQPVPESPRGLGRIFQRRRQNLPPVRQRLRWIPPGRFLMGSPATEEGRSDREGPQHEVSMATGFWFFDTPCTQALWEAVMGGNPSAFKGRDRPVETVSWDDCQEFVRRVNERLVGLKLGLPSEAQWEYACRAGSDAARYDREIGEIAWYSDNSRGETQAVKWKAPNGWGLYEMLGNVWEWCADAWYDDYASPRAPEPGGKSSAPRVIRGGSWLVSAQLVRAACRGRSAPSDRFDGLGFRCAEFRDGNSSS